MGLAMGLECRGTMAAESLPLISPNPQIETSGRPSVADPAASDKIDTTDYASEIQRSKSSPDEYNVDADAPPTGTAVLMVDEPKEDVASDEGGDLRGEIETDLRKMSIEQSLIVTDYERFHVDNNWEDEKDVERFTHDVFYEDHEKDVVEIVGDDNRNMDSDEDGNARGNSVDGTRISRKYKQNSNGYPLRPDAEDCPFYMRFRSCKFGLSCKFNHPTWRKNQGVKERPNHREENSERAGQNECKYYLAFGGCKYGKDCKYSHGPDKSSASQIQEFNFLGLPIRHEEKECPYYMRTGSCKYGANCRFHHPEPSAVVGGDHSSGYCNGGTLPSQLVSSSISSWSSPRSFNETSSVQPLMFPPSQGSSNTKWNGYQTATYPMSERGLPIPPAFAADRLSVDINFPVQRRHNKLFEDYPERPGEPECSFFMRTGDCKFKSSCKFDHPKNRLPKPKPANSDALNDKGLPLRPDQPICTYYYRYGICKYGPACKYDHSPNYFVRPTGGGALGFAQGNEHGS